MKQEITEAKPAFQRQRNILCSDNNQLSHIRKERIKNVIWCIGFNRSEAGTTCQTDN